MTIKLSNDALYNRLSVLSKTLGSGKKNSSSVLNSFLFSINPNSNTGVGSLADAVIITLKQQPTYTTTQTTYIYLSEENEDNTAIEESNFSVNEKHNKFRIRFMINLRKEEIYNYCKRNHLDQYQKTHLTLEELFTNKLIEYDTDEGKEMWNFIHSDYDEGKSGTKGLTPDEQDFKNTYIRMGVQEKDFISFLSRLECCKNYSQLAGILNKYKVTILEEFSITRMFCESLIPLVGFKTTKNAENFRRSLSSHYTEKKTA